MTQPLPAKLIAQRYTLRALMGQGGMGAVYLADDLQARRRVALKVIRPEFSSDPRTRRRFNKESRAFAYLKHPNIVEVFDFGQDADDGTLYLSMELVKGYSLRVLRHVDLPLSQVLSIIDQLLAALAHAHARGVIHRDLKPENVLVTQAPDDTAPIVKLVDFGLASLPAADEMSHTGSILGTPSYMAPEQARGPRGVVGPSTDIYAVGVILYELLCDRLPFEADSQVELILKHVQQPVPPLRPRPGVTAPPGLEAVIHRAMAKKPWDRFVNAAEFRRALKAVEVPFEPMPLLEPPADAPWLLPEDPAPAAPKPARAPLSSLSSLSFPAASAPYEHPSIDVAAVASSIDAVMLSPPPAAATNPAQTPSPALTSAPTPAPTPSQSGAHRVTRPRSGRWRPISSQSIPAMAVPAVVEHIPTPPVAAAFGPTTAQELVGRDAEVALLDGVVQRVLAGQGQVVLIDGEQGIGKSALARALLHRFTETGTMRAALGTYTATEGGGPGAGIRGAVESLFNTTNSDRASMEQQARGVLERLGLHDPRDQREVTSFLRPLSADDLSASLSDDAAQRQRSRLGLIQRLLRLVAQEMPLVLLFEDIHWASDGLTGFIESMINAFRVQPIPCLLLCTFTPAELDPSGAVAEGIGRLSRFSGQGLHQVHLSRLPRDHSLALIQRLAPCSPALAEQLADRAGGNPLYAIQMLQSLQQDRQLVRGDDGLWRVADGVALESVLPSSVAEVLRRRLQRTTARFGAKSDAYQQILVRAAVLGSACEVNTLEAYLQLEADEGLLHLFDDALDAWVQHGILREVRDRTADVFEFDHPLMRDVLLESVPRRKLRRLHLHAANLKRDRFYPLLAPVASDISEHYRQAGELGLAAEYTLMAARHHETTGQFRQATSLYERLHKLYESHTGDFSGLLSAASSSSGLRALSSATAERPQQHTPPSGTHALALDWSEVWLGLGRIAIAQGALDRAQAMSEQMQRYGEQHQQMLPQGKAQWLMARVSTRRSDLVDAWERYNLARDLFEAEQDMNGVALCLWGMGEVARMSGWLEDARNYVTSAMTAFEENKRRGEVATCQQALGDIAQAGGLLTTARDHYARAQETFAALSDVYHVHHSQLGLALVSLSLGLVREGFQQLTALNAAFRDLGDRHGQALCQQGLARALMEARQYDAAAAALEDAFNAFQQLSDPKSASQAQRLQATLMRWRGAAAQAIHYIGQATEYANRTQDRQGIGACYLERAWIALELGDPHRASEHLDIAHEHYNLSGDALGVTACAELCAHIELARGAHTRALEYVHQGLDLTEQTGAAPMRANLLACGLEVCVHLQSWSELRTMATALDALQLAPQTLGAPQLSRALRAATARLAARPSLEPDLRMLQRRFEQLAAAAEAGTQL